MLATYGDDFYAGMPVVTENRFGGGRAYYIASDPEERFLDDFYGRILAHHEIRPLLETPSGVEVALRQTEKDRLLFVLNHNAGVETIALPAGERYHDLLGDRDVADTLDLPGYGVSILAATGSR